MAKKKPEAGQAGLQAVKPPELSLVVLQPGSRETGVIPHIEVNGGGPEFTVSLPWAMKVKFNAPDQFLAIRAYNRFCGVIKTSEEHLVETPAEEETDENAE